MNTDWMTSMLEWFKIHSDITTVIVVVFFFWMWVRSKKRSREVNNLNAGTTSIPTPAPTTNTPTTVEAPKKKGEKWDKTKTVATGIGTGLGWLIKTSIGIAIFIFVGSYAIQGVQSVRDWEPARSARGGGSQVIITLTQEWSKEPLQQNWKHSNWGIKTIPEITKHGIWFRFDAPDGTLGQEIFEAPGENGRYIPPQGDRILRIKLAGDEPKIVQAKVWWR